jgi:transketolase
MDLRKKADEIRKELVRVAVANGAGHIAPSLSSVDILTALHYRVLRRDSDPRNPERDRLLFSKGHGCYGLYAILADIGWIARADWESFYRGGPLTGCPERSAERGIEAGCGSLGHGLPMATGLAFGARLQGLGWRVYCVAGDGEMQEGAMWEALQFAVWHRLSNLTLIIDRNNLQAMDFCRNVLTLPDRPQDLRIKCEAFGAHAVQVPGHDAELLAAELERLNQLNDDKPHVLVAETIKGYGIRCMENIPRFHFRLPTAEEMAQGTRYE